MNQTAYRAAKVDGIDIFYREAGRTGARKLLLLHGFPTSSHMFRDLIPLIADRFHVVAPALRVGDLVSLRTPREPPVQPVDRHLVEVAAAHRGVYELAAASDRQDVVRLAARRLRELERAGLVASSGPGRWAVPSDLIERLEKRHRQVPARYRLSVEALPLGLDALVGHRDLGIAPDDPQRRANISDLERQTALLLHRPNLEFIP